MSDSISALHFIPGLHAYEGGPSRSVICLTDAIASIADISVTLISHSVSGLQSVPSENRLVRRKTITSSNSLLLRLGFIDRRLLVETLATQNVNVLHSHSLWHPGNHWAMSIAAKHAIPLICQPRGTLSQWALNHKAWKKRLGMSLFLREDLVSTHAFIATSHMEAEDIRRLGMRQPVAIIPNGVDLSLAQSIALPAVKKSECDKVLLFLSRIHPVKGITNLVSAWAKCRAPGWRLILAGPGDAGYVQTVLRQIEQSGVADSVEYVGEITGAAKAAMYTAADLFVLPSYSENFGMVVAEALTFGIPVITTNATPWPELQTCRCGWWIDTGVEPLIETLREAMALTDDARAEMGKRSKALAARYQWSTAAERTTDFYRWLLGRGDRPDCVVAD